MENDEVQLGSSWAEMAPDLLANIFARLSLQDLLVIVPVVCKAWQLASLNPLCYASLDLRGFSTLSVDGLLEHIVLPRSQGRLQHIFFSSVRNLSSMYLLANSAPLLRTLHVPESSLDDKWAAYAAPLMPHIVDLNLSLCSNDLTYLGIEAFGKSCRHVSKFRRNRAWGQIGATSNDEALAIAQYYPGIKHLELQSNPLSEEGLKGILFCCPDLEYIDLAGSPYLLDMDSSLLNQCRARIKYFREPIMYPCEPSDDDKPFLTYICEASSIDADDDPWFVGFADDPPWS